MEDFVPDTPLTDRKIVQSTSAKHNDESETVATVPFTQRFTQPTQLIDGNAEGTKDISVVQVAASSPPTLMSPPTSLRLASGHSKGGVLSSIMAPTGTRFCPPQQPAKRVPVIEADDDGPTYRGGSSDDDRLTISDIKPSSFVPSRSPGKVMETPINTSTLDKFKEFTALAVYNPAAKRTASEMQPTRKTVTVKKIRQGSPSRAQPVTRILLWNEIDDFQTRTKVERMLKVMPSRSVQACIDALKTKRGNYEDALEYLAASEADNDRHVESSDDELSIVEQKEFTKPAKQEIKAHGRIQDKWTSIHSQNLKSQKTPILLSGGDQPKARRRLIRGIKADMSSRSASRKAGGHSYESPTASILISDNSESEAEEEEDGQLETKVLKFLNTCGALDLADIANVNDNVANILISHRPFKSLDNVRAVYAPPEDGAKSKGRGRAKRIGDRIVEKCLEMWAGYEAVDSLVAQCAALGEPITKEMRNWGVDIFGKREGELELVSFDTRASHDSGIGTPSSQRSGADDASGRQFISQPVIMAGDVKMKDYQIVGINWLSLLFEKQLSCILADDMGLGKTCQVIAFLAHLFEQGIKGPHLIVVPSSTIENWLREFQKFCPTLSVMPYYAGQAERGEIREIIESNRDSINVVITTYTLAKGKIDAHFLRKMNFCVCVYDEGHMLKSSKSIMYEKLMRISARFRLLLTGTPLQNNLQELASLLGFILPKVFNERKEDLQYIFANKARTDDESHAILLSAQRIERAKSMLKPFVLRRKKHQVIDLPQKTSRVEYCTMNSAQKEIYASEQEKVRKLLEDRAAGKQTAQKSVNVLMKLRLAAIHPLLHRRHYTDTILKRMAKACLKEELWSQSNPDVIFQELLDYSDFECHDLCLKWPRSLGKFALKKPEWMYSGKVDKLCELLQRFKENGDRTLVFSQFTMVMDILEHVLETQQFGFVRLDGRTSVEDRQSILDAFHERTDIPVFLLSTKAGGAGINLACANKVIIFDSSFNPQEDVQAENRAHRVGQTREVEVVRLVTKDTVEEQIHALGQTKLALDQAVTGDEPAETKNSEESGMKAVEDMVFARLQHGNEASTEQ